MPEIGDFTDFEAAADAAEQTDPLFFTFHGARFEVASQVSIIPIMRMAKAASSGLDSAEMEGLVALYDFLDQTLAPGEFARFVELADAKKIGDETLLRIVMEVYAAVAARPTERPSSSSDGRPRTSATSKPRSSSPAMTSAGLSEDDLLTPEQAAALLRAV